MQFDLHEIWAKTDPYQSILTHSALSGIVAQVIARHMIAPGILHKLSGALSCSTEEAISWIGYLVSLHDIGKIEEKFQSRWSVMGDKMDQQGSRFSTPIRHEKTTCQCLQRIWKNCRIDKFYANLLGAHHQGKWGKAGECENQFWNELQERLESQMRVRFLHSDMCLSAPGKKDRGSEDRGSVGALLLGIVILSDWIASSDYFAQAETWFHQPDAQEHAVYLAKTFLKVSGLESQSTEWESEFHQVWPSIAREGMRGLQAETEVLFEQAQERISVVLLEAPMGEGKTEAGVYAALQMAQQWGKCGFYVGLPTAATSNQMVERMRTFLQMHHASEPVRLLHSMAWLSDDETQSFCPDFDTEEERYAWRWLLPVRRGLLGSYAVGTVDQAMMSVLLVKYGVLRLLGLAQKALIIDELHSYDVYMGEILHRLLEWCKALEIPVVLLSATLPPEKKTQMLSAYTNESIPSSYPAVTAITESGKVLVRTIQRTEKRQTVSVTLCPILHQAEKIAVYAKELVHNGGCLCILLNTVQQAQETFQALKTIGFDGEMLLFHARFPAEQRDRIEQHCIRLFGKEKSMRPHKAILVATQVVEQSLDVDFDLMMTAIAPIDLVLQRLGRMFRHQDTPRPPHITVPNLYVLVPELSEQFGADGFVYPACLLQQSIHLLEQYTSIRIPEDLPVLVTRGYDPQAAPPEELSSWMEHLIEDQVKAAMSGNYLIHKPGKGYSPIKESEKVQFDDLESTSYFSAKTRLGEPTIRIALLPSERFQYFCKKSEKYEDRIVLSAVSKEEAREILKSSVSVRAKLLHSENKNILFGRRLLEGIQIYPAVVDKDGNMQYNQGGTEIIVDKELGVIFKDGDVSESKV